MEVVTKIAPIILALIMLGLGLGLKFEEFYRIIKTPKDFFIGLFSQLIILPIIAYLLILILKTSPEIAIGVMIIAAAPGGVNSNSKKRYFITPNIVKKFIPAIKDNFKFKSVFISKVINTIIV